MITMLALSTLLAAGPGGATGRFYTPHVELWTNRGDSPYAQGDGARVSFQIHDDAYVTVFRIDTDGRVRVLFPRLPDEDDYVRGGSEFEIQGVDSPTTFEIDDYPGVGYVFAVVSSDPFDFSQIATGDHWDYRAIADDRVHGDPYVAVTDLANRIVASSSEWDYDVVPYYVQQHYDYPRFLCYDCHSYAAFPFWNPYDYSCVRFRIEVFDDPYYYPYRYGGTRVVFTRPFHAEPRFVFKDRGTATPFISYIRQQPTDDDTRRGVVGADVGGVGSIPTPRRRDWGGAGGDPQGGQRPASQQPQPGTPDNPDARRRPQTQPDGQGIARPPVITPQRPVPQPQQPAPQPQSRPRPEPPPERAKPQPPPPAPRDRPQAKPQASSSKPPEPSLRRRKP